MYKYFEIQKVHGNALFNVDLVTDNDKDYHLTMTKSLDKGGTVISLPLSKGEIAEVYQALSEIVD